ncbi:transglutaminase domain-containing protein [Kineococcus sp. R8]|nr:transglutaminase domain-containing protein [Kineococcus siccus]
MTCAALTPWWLTRHALAQRAADGGTAGTAVLDVGSAPVVELACAARRLAGAAGDRVLLQRAHRLVATRVRPVYAVEEFQPASTTLRRGRGSCSQRLAVLEAVARSSGIATRCRGLLVDGAFWSPRFPRLRRVLPSEVVLAWPEFHLAGRWVPVSELFGPVAPRARPFTNTGAETLFDALARSAVAWGAAAWCPPDDCGAGAPVTVVADLGRFSSRDELFAVHGQTLCRPARFLVDPWLSRVAAGASRPG